jgi:guanylate kinase
LNRKLIIVCAPSGSGKTTIVRHILENISGIEFSVSATNRPMRKNEANGYDYYFIGTEEFRKKIDEQAFLEWEEVYPGRFYGTLRSEVDRIWNRGNHVIFDVDVEGGLNIKKQYGDRALLVFIRPPSLEHLRERLQKRGTENKESLDTRMKKAEKEMEYELHADKVLVNDRLDVSVKEAENIVRTFLESTQ